MPLPFLDLARRELEPELVMRLPESLARRHRALVIGQQDDGLMVALFRPDGHLRARRSGSRAAQHAVHPVVVTEKSLMDVVDCIYQRREQVTWPTKWLPTWGRLAASWTCWLAPKTRRSSS